jgi:hypothetical protein
MGAFDLFWHLTNLFSVGVLFGLLTALGARWIWRRELARVSARRLVAWAVLPPMGVALAGLLVFGQDGRMATYAAMVGAAALGLAGAGWRPRP